MFTINLHLYSGVFLQRQSYAGLIRESQGLEYQVHHSFTTLYDITAISRQCAAWLIQAYSISHIANISSVWLMSSPLALQGLLPLSPASCGTTLMNLPTGGIRTASALVTSLARVTIYPVITCCQKNISLRVSTVKFTYHAVVNIC